MGNGSTGWQPPHCPGSNCIYHNNLSRRWRYKRTGYYRRATAPRCVQRFTCLACGRHFSSQTFSFTYWQKRPELIRPIAAMVVGCMANRQIARALRCAPSTVAHHIARLGRHALLFQARDLQRLSLTGDIVIDGFETFEWSQYYPFHHNLAVEADTGYFLFHTDSPLRRKGRMTPHQKKRRRHLEDRFGKAHPRAVEHGIRELLETLPSARTPLRIRSDDHPAYARALRSFPNSTIHLVTSSKRRRTHLNPLWEINLLDLMIRHSTAAHKRETIAWAKRRQAAAEKLAVFQVWRNYVKRRWEKGTTQTSAMIKGLATRPLAFSDILAPRLFRTRQWLPPRWALYYDRRVETAPLSVNRRHTLAYAY